MLIFIEVMFYTLCGANVPGNNICGHSCFYKFIFSSPHPLCIEAGKAGPWGDFICLNGTAWKKKAEQRQDYILTVLWNGSGVLYRGPQWPVNSTCLRWLVTRHYESTRENNKIRSWTSEHNVTLTIEFFLNYLFLHSVFILKNFNLLILEREEWTDRVYIERD